MTPTPTPTQRTRLYFCFVELLIDYSTEDKLIPLGVLINKVYTCLGIHWRFCVCTAFSPLVIRSLHTYTNLIP